MNNNKKVVFLIVVVTIIHLLLSVFSSEFIRYYPNFKNVNLLSDILYDAKGKTQQSKQQNAIDQEEIAQSLPYNDFDSYVKKGTIVAFNGDTIEPALKSFNEKLIQLSQNKKVKIRIAWFGDSQIEGDFITQDLRVMLQNYFGQQSGVGFIHGDHPVRVSFCLTLCPYFRWFVWYFVVGIYKIQSSVVSYSCAAATLFGIGHCSILQV